ncbi:MAG TPA: cyclopropane-fatty-acyl-phospholipid synthase family protein [Gaiellales bacterium]|nr:cyclopropane-fatty-acyl-phospholipid synthase family protein [Gaiellales bacterium]
MGGLTLAAAPPRRAPVRSRIARALFERAVSRLEQLEVIGPDGDLLRCNPGAPRMEITSERFFDRLGRDGKIGFGEAYMAGDWRTADLPGVLLAFATGLTSLIPAPFQRLRALYEPSHPVHEANTQAGARRNIQRHYDLSNELFGLFLDETMTYSCAIFEPGDSLADAQRRKYRAMADLARLEPGHHVLEIGTGWGGMAIHAASEIGCRVTTITISEQQHDFARRRVARAGLADRVEVLLRDYREMEGRFDRIVSIEMFEALGEEYWPVFFAACDRLLAPGGRMALQTITMPHDRHRASRRSYTWMHKYIFPGGLIPSEQALDAALRKASSLRAVERRQIGQHYGPTLHAWRDRFLARWGDVRALGFDDGFRRMWEFYLAYCEAGFRAGALGDVQLALERP